MGSTKATKITFLCAIILLALFLRLFRLDGQSLWSDEGVSVALALRDLPTITRDAAHDIHPPLYYYLLHFWVSLLGTSEVAVRSLSVVCGLLLVATTYLLGEALFDTRVALISSFISAISPFQVYYSQETRMYILVALLGSLSLLFSLRFAKRVKPWVSITLYTLCITWALYTHYFAFTVFLAANAAYGLWLLLEPSARRPRWLLLWALSQLAVLLLYLPWLRLAEVQLHSWPAISQPISLLFLLQEVVRVFSLGPWAETSPLLLGFLALLILGLIPKRECYPLAVAFLYFLLPPLTMYLLSLSRPLYRPKLLLLATPGYYLLLARGVSGTWLRRANIRNGVTGGLLLFLALASAFPLYNYFLAPRYARDDYRGLANYIAATGREGDAILLNAPGQIDIFSYYYKGPLPVYPLPGERPLDEGKTEEALEEIAALHRRLFAVLWATEESDPGRFIEGWLGEQAFRASDVWYGNVRLVIYSLPLTPISEDIREPREAVFGGHIRFLGYTFLTPEVEAGDILPLTLFWQATAKIEGRHKVFIHILDSQNHIVGQRDAEPGGGAKPTITWPAEEIIADNYGILILPGTPPGEYRVEMGMYNLFTGERLPVREREEVGDKILLPPIRVTKPDMPLSPEALQMESRVDVDFGPLRLLGYNLAKLGFEHDPQAPLYPGDTLHLTLFWQARERPQEEMGLALELWGPQGRLVAQQEVSPLKPGYPLTSWKAGEVVRDQHHLSIPSYLSPGRYRLLLRMKNAQNKEIQPSPILLEPLRLR